MTDHEITFTGDELHEINVALDMRVWSIVHELESSIRAFSKTSDKWSKDAITKTIDTITALAAESNGEEGLESHER